MTTSPDPRRDSRYVRTLPGPDGAGAVTLVGVVHDHPASVYRVRTTVAERAPDALALELPPAVVPLYAAYADAGGTPPRLGGEFSAAVAAADTDDVVGIDGPSAGFVRRFLGRLHRERASPRTAARSLRSLASVTGTALASRLAATVTRRTPFTVAVGSPVDHETTRADDPEDQAADERRQIRRATAVMDAFEPSPSTRYRAETREAHMAARLETVRERGDVVAVVGAGHFDPLCDRLAE